MTDARLLVVLLAALALALLTPGCEAETLADRPCPPGGTGLTYDNFGRGFFEVWCVRCHGGPNAYSSRSFTTLSSIQTQRERIFANTIPDNAAMPPGPDDPPRAERDRLAEWLACGAP